MTNALASTAPKARSTRLVWSNSNRLLVSPGGGPLAPVWTGSTRRIAVTVLDSRPLVKRSVTTGTWCRRSATQRPTLYRSHRLAESRLLRRGSDFREIEDGLRPPKKGQRDDGGAEKRLRVHDLLDAIGVSCEAP